MSLHTWSCPQSFLDKLLENLARGSSLLLRLWRTVGKERKSKRQKQRDAQQGPGMASCSQETKGHRTSRTWCLFAEENGEGTVTAYIRQVARLAEPGTKRTEHPCQRDRNNQIQVKRSTSNLLNSQHWEGIFLWNHAETLSRILTCAITARLAEPTHSGGG